MQFALDHPERVIALTLVDSVLPGFSYGDETTAHFQSFANTVRSDGPRTAIDEVWLQHPFFDGVRRDPELYETVAPGPSRFPGTRHARGRPAERVPARYRGRLNEIKAPTLVIAGEYDIPDFRLIADVLAENIPHARQAIIPDCWHLPPNEKPDEFNRLLIGFLRESTS